MSKRSVDTLSILLEGNALCAADIAADGTVRGTHHTTLTVDPLTAKQDLVAQDLRQQLAPLNGRWKHALVGLPLDRLMVTRVPVPEMPEAALPSFIGLQAERDFLVEADRLALGWSIDTAPDGSREAIVIAMQLTAYDNLAAALREFGVRGLTVTAGPLMAASAVDTTTGARLIIGGSGIDMAVLHGGNVVLLRRVAGEQAAQGVDVETLAQLPAEIRLSLSQLPSHVTDTISEIRVLGSTRRSKWVSTYLMDLPERSARSLPVIDTGFDDSQVPGVQICSIAGRTFVTGTSPCVALRRPDRPAQSSRLPQGAKRPLVYAAVIALLVIVGIAVAMVQQERTLQRVETEAATLAAEAATIRVAMDRAQADGDWHSDQPVSLDLLQAVTTAFPERGTVWLTRLEVSERRQVRLTGKAATREAWLAVVDALRASPGTQDLRVAQTQESADGRSPLVFSVTFSWQAPSDLPTTGTKR